MSKEKSVRKLVNYFFDPTRGSVVLLSAYNKQDFSGVSQTGLP